MRIMKINAADIIRPGLLLIAALGLAIFLTPAQARTQGNEGPLTQADIDGYVYLLPRLGPQLKLGGDAAAQILRDSGLSRRRAAYVTSKVAMAQALATGLLSSKQMRDDQVPLYLQPSTEELDLVTKNLVSIQKAQALARQAAAPLAVEGQ